LFFFFTLFSLFIYLSFQISRNIITDAGQTSPSESNNAYPNVDLDGGESASYVGFVATSSSTSGYAQPGYEDDGQEKALF